MIELRYTDGCESCDDCGQYEWDLLEVFKNGELVLRHYGDGHLNGGTVESMDPVELLEKVMRAIGMPVQVLEPASE